MPTPILWINTSLVKWTPTGGTLVNLNRITQAGLSFGAEVINARADLDIYDSSAHIVGWKPTVTFSGLNVIQYMTLVSGIGAISWTTGNADNQTGAGSVTWTLSPAMNPLGDYSGPHGQYASGNLSFMGLAADGLTNPLSFSVLSSGSFLGANARATPPAAANLRLARSGRSFAPPAEQGAPPGDDARPDAVLVSPARYADKSHFLRICRLQSEAAKLLGVDPDKVSVRPQGEDRVVSASGPAVGLMHARDSDLAGEHRYRWFDRGDGVRLGYLTDEAKEADADVDAA